MFKSNKRGIVPLLGMLLNPVILVILGVLAILFLLAAFGFAFFLTTNVFTLLGAFLVVIGALGLAMKFSTPNIAFTFIGIGILLLVLPSLVSSLGGATLAVVMP